MEKTWPVGLPLGAGAAHQRQLIETRLSLAAVADGLGSMVWIGTGHSQDGPPVQGYRVDEQGQAHCTTMAADAVLASDCTKRGPADVPKHECQRGGFGKTGGQFYRVEEGL